MIIRNYPLMHRQYTYKLLYLTFEKSGQCNWNIVFLPFNCSKKILIVIVLLYQYLVEYQNFSSIFMSTLKLYCIDCSRWLFSFHSSWESKSTFSEEMRGQLSKFSIFLIITTLLRTGESPFLYFCFFLTDLLAWPAVGRFGCTNVCCVDCVDEEICARCYQLFGNKIGCPCVQHNTGQESRFVGFKYN